MYGSVQLVILLNVYSSSFNMMNVMIKNIVYGFENFQAVMRFMLKKY